MSLTVLLDSSNYSGDLDPTRIADWRLQAGWQGLVAGKLHFSASDPFFGSTDVFDYLWTEFFTGSYSDLTDDINEGTSVQWSRGTDVQVQAQIEAGQMTFTLCNASTPNLYDPNDPTSPLYGTFVPMRPVRLIGSLDNWKTTQGAFYGFITEALYDPDTYTCQVTCQDLFGWLDRVSPVITSTSGLTSSGALQLILASIGFSDPAYLKLESVPAITGITFTADGSKTAVELINEILDAERGTCWIDGNGAFHFEGRYARDAKLTAAYDFETPLVGLQSKISIDLIGNRALVTANATGDQEVAVDTGSDQQYGASDIANITSDYIPDDAHSRDLAALLVQRGKSAPPPLIATVDNDTVQTITAQLAVDVNQRDTVDGIDCFVERIDQELDAGGMRLATQLTVTEAPASRALLFGSTPAFSTSASPYFG